MSKKQRPRLASPCVDDSVADAAHEDAARLISEVGACYVRGRRYRAIAAECERWLTVALTMGARLRAQARSSPGDVPADPDVIRGLRDLIDEFQAAVNRVHENDVYRRAVCAWQAESYGEVAALAPTIFDGVVPLTSPRTLYVPVEVGSRHGGEHFASPIVVAERAMELLRNGIPAARPVPDQGADDHIGAVVFDDDADAGGSPVTIVVAASDLGLPAFHLEPGGASLVYAPRVEFPASVRCASEVTDEWWAIRPDAYANFTTELSRMLRARGVTRIERG